jgi:hypothetical protein
VALQHRELVQLLEDEISREERLDDKNFQEMQLFKIFLYLFISFPHKILSEIPLPSRYLSLSVITSKPPDMRAIDANDGFGLIGDGISDDTDALQRAIFAPYSSSLNNSDCTTPGNRVIVLKGDGYIYRITRTISLPIWTRLVGYGLIERPVILLGENTQGFNSTLDLVKPMFLVVDWSPSPGNGPRANSQCNISINGGGDTAFGTGILNIDIKIKSQNPAAVGISNGAAQGGVLRSMSFTLANDSLAAIWSPGWSHTDVVVNGGKYAVIIFISGAWPSLFRDCAFVNQVTASISYQFPSLSPWEGLTILRSWFGNIPIAIDLSNALSTSRVSLSDCLFRNITTSLIRPSNDMSNGNSSFALHHCKGDLVNILIEAVNGIFPLLPTPTGGVNNTFQIQSIIAGTIVKDARYNPNTITIQLIQEGVEALLTPLDINATPPLPLTFLYTPVNTWISVLDEGLVNDGKTDNALALNALLMRVSISLIPISIFFPQGIYVLSDKVLIPKSLVSNIHLFGLSCWDVVLTLSDNAVGFMDPKSRRPILHIEGGEQSNSTASVWISGMNIRSGFSFGTRQPLPVPIGWTNPNPGAIALLFERGTNSSGIQDVFFHPNTFPDNSHEGIGPGSELSLVISNEGSALIADVWSCNSYSKGGVLVVNTTKRVQFEQLSSEHHQEHELWVSNATNVHVYSMQTEDRVDSSPTSSISVDTGSSIMITGLFSYYTSNVPSIGAIVIDESSSANVEIFRSYRSYHPLYYNCSIFAEGLNSSSCLSKLDFAFASLEAVNSTSGGI